MRNDCSRRAGELLLKAGLGIISWTPLVPTACAPRASGLHGAGSRVGAGVGGRKRTAAVAGLPRDPVGREYSSCSRDVLLNNPFVTPADLEAAGDASYRSSAGSGARARGRGPASASCSPRVGAGGGGAGTYTPANPYSAGVASTPMEMEEEEEREPQTGPDTALDAARANSLQNAVAAVLRALFAGRASFELPDDPLTALHPDDDLTAYSGGGPTATRAAPVPPSETDCVILGLRCLHRIYDINGRYFHDEYAITTATECSTFFLNFVVT